MMTKDKSLKPGWRKVKFEDVPAKSKISLQRIKTWPSN